MLSMKKQMTLLMYAGTVTSCLVLGGLGHASETEQNQQASQDQQTSSQQARQPAQEGRHVKRSVQKRSHTSRDAGADAARIEAYRHTERGVGGPAVYPFEFRTIDGLLNNIANPHWGAAATEMMRMMGDAYPLSSGDIPARLDGPSARAVSNALCAEIEDRPNAKFASDYLWQWGQFLDHDIDETPIGSPAVAFDIPVPTGDPYFDPMNTGTQIIGMNRSSFEIDEHGDRQQANEITAFIDASNVYGSDDARAAALRMNDGTGMLKTSAGNLLPLNTDGFPNAPTSADPTMFFAGDVRANEQAGLTAMHTLFVREHNYWASQMAIEFPAADGDELYERARAIVGAEMQAITFNEFLPMLLGDGAIEPYAGYDANVEPSIANMFASAAYRVGHTMLSSTLQRVSVTDTEADEGHLALKDAFFDPSHMTAHGIDSILRGFSTQRAQTIDTYVIDDVRNFLFGPPGAGGFDLASLNIQRGRDHGLPDLNSARVAMGLNAHTSFADVSDDPVVVSGLSILYSSVDEIDPWVGLLAEPATGESMVGETLHKILVDQFTRLRDGDRFWYESYLPSDLVELVNEQTLAKIIRRNSGVGLELPDHVFVAQAPCPGDMNHDGLVNFFDVSEFISLFQNQDPRADMHGGDGLFNFFDINEFIQAHQAGCP